MNCSSLSSLQWDSCTLGRKRRYRVSCSLSLISRAYPQCNIGLIDNYYACMYMCVDADMLHTKWELPDLLMRTSSIVNEHLSRRIQLVTFHNCMFGLHIDDHIDLDDASSQMDGTWNMWRQAGQVRWGEWMYSSTFRTVHSEADELRASFALITKQKQPTSTQWHRKKCWPFYEQDHANC